MEDQSRLISEEERIRTFIHYQNLIKQITPEAIERVVDIGCGSSSFWPLWFEQGIGTWGVELTEEHQEPLKTTSQTAVVYAKPRKMWPFSNNFFDAATLIDIPHLYTDPMPLISQAHRVLKKHGVLLVVISQEGLRTQESNIDEKKIKRPDYWYGLISGLGFHRVRMKQYFTYVLPPFSFVRKIFRSVGLPTREYMIPVPSTKIAQRYLFLSQK